MQDRIEALLRPNKAKVNRVKTHHDLKGYNELSVQASQMIFRKYSHHLYTKSLG